MTSHNTLKPSFSVCRHHSAKHRNVCHSTKYLMLHVRDCSGLLSNGDVCPFPWCRKVKHLLYHLVSCEDGKKCSICCSADDTKLSSNLQTLVGLNTHRRNKFRERVKAVLAKRQQMAASAARGGVKPGAEGHVKLPAQSANTSVAPTSQVSKAGVTPANVHRPAAKPSASSSTVAGATSAIQKTQPQKPSPTANPASAAVAASSALATTAKTSINPPPQHQQQQIPSPALSASLSGLPSALSVSGLPTLEEAALEIGDLSMSASDFMSPEVNS